MVKTQFDVIVVGGGGSGLACAMAAAQGGADVLLLEKRLKLGGATGLAIGSFTANRTALQRKAGIDDDPDAHEEDAAKFGPPAYQAKNNRALRRFFFNHGADTLDWLGRLGLSFYGPNAEPLNRVSRMHNVVPNAKAYIAAFQLGLLRTGGTILCNAPAEQVVVDGGRVAGVVANVEGERRTVHARRGVVLAAGDYANASDIIARYRGPEFTAIEGINPHALGDGHRLAEQAGAKLVNMEITYGPELRFVPPARDGFEQLLPSKGLAMRAMGMMMPLVPKRIIHWMIKRLLVTWQHPEDAILADGAILLNREGRRFCNELESPAREVAVGDVWPKKLAEWLQASLARMPEALKRTGIPTMIDYRELLERSDVDAVIITTCDHWHALPAIHACQAGKDVYGEKPLSLTIAEGRAMVNAVRAHRRVFQTGAQQRSYLRNRQGCELIRNGKLGQIKEVRCVNYGSAKPASAYELKTEPVPDGMD